MALTSFLRIVFIHHISFLWLYVHVVSPIMLKTLPLTGDWKGDTMDGYVATFWFHVLSISCGFIPPFSATASLALCKKSKWLVRCRAWYGLCLYFSLKSPLKYWTGGSSKSRSRYVFSYTMLASVHHTTIFVAATHFLNCIHLTPFCKKKAYLGYLDT